MSDPTKDPIAMQAQHEAELEHERKRDTIPVSRPVHTMSDRELLEEAVERLRGLTVAVGRMDRELYQVSLAGRETRDLARRIDADQKLTNKSYGLLGQRMTAIEQQCRTNHDTTQPRVVEDEIETAVSNERVVNEAQEA